MILCPLRLQPRPNLSLEETEQNSGGPDDHSRINAYAARLHNIATGQRPAMPLAIRITCSSMAITIAIMRTLSNNHGSSRTITTISQTTLLVRLAWDDLIATVALGIFTGSYYVARLPVAKQMSQVRVSAGSINSSHSFTTASQSFWSASWPA